jgi:hypothetical protein
MSPDVVTALVAAVAPTVLALAALVAALRNGGKLHELHLSVNSRMDQLIAASRAEGAQEHQASLDVRDAKTLQVAKALKDSTAIIAADLKSDTAVIAKDLAK